jgi:hypothetical protein
VGLASLILVLALIAGRLLGGRLTELGELKLRGAGWLVAALLAQVLGSLLSSVERPAYPIGLALSAALAVVFAYQNRHLAGVPLAALGLLLNAVVVGLNGSMPVSAHAAARAGVSAEDLSLPADPRHEAMTPDTAAPFLGAVIPVPIPAKREVNSPGDVLLAAGIGLLVVTGMSPAGRSRRSGYFHEPDRDPSPVL